MTCKHYWREGVLLFEQGQPDPHREHCRDCQRAHARREDLIGALPRIGADQTGNPRWQAAVWKRIDGPGRRARMAWCSAAAAAVSMAVVTGWYIGHETCPAEPVRLDETITVVAGPVGRLGDARLDGAATRRAAFTPAPVARGGAAPELRTAQIGDWVEVELAPEGELRVYRAERLIRRCRAAIGPGCVAVPGGVRASAFASAGDYQLVIVAQPIAGLTGALSRDLAAIVRAGGRDNTTEFSVR